MNEEGTSKSEFKKERVERAIRRKSMGRIFWVLGIIGILGAVVAGGSWLNGRHEETAIGTFYPNLGQSHISLGEISSQSYNSNPPSSGAHYASPANEGIYDIEVYDQIFIHNLEHGGIWFSYRPEIPSDALDELRAVAEEFGVSKIVMAPRSANDTDIAIVAWTRVLSFDLVDGTLTDEHKDDIRTFYKQYKDRGPEFVPGFMSGIDPREVK